MDRERLQQVHQTDLTESRVNEDFLDWLKNKGPTWLLVVLLAVVAFLAVNKWRESGQRKIDDAWRALGDAPLPASLEEIATEHAGVYAVPELALLGAADQLMRSVQMNQKLGATSPDDPAATPEPLDDLTRNDYLDRAARDYQQVIDLAEASDMPAERTTLHLVRATMGLAAVEESRGNFGAARDDYDRAAKYAEQFYPTLAKRALARKDTIVEGELPAMPTSGDLSTATLQRTPETPRKVTLDPTLEAIIYTDDTIVPDSDVQGGSDDPDTGVDQ